MTSGKNAQRLCKFSACARRPELGYIATNAVGAKWHCVASVTVGKTTRSQMSLVSGLRGAGTSDLVALREEIAACCSYE
eukprot:3772925-Amphidinium_carterae.1